MPLKIRLIFAALACVLLSNCQLINTALRLAPLAMLFVEDDTTKRAGKTPELRGKEIESRGTRGLLPTAPEAESGLAFRQ